MTSGQDLLRLMSWLSPAFPTGAFSYSHGLEAAVADECVTSREDLKDWLDGLICCGSGWNDAVLLAQSWQRAQCGAGPAPIAELAEAMATSRERHLETMAQGAAFLAAARAWQTELPKDLPLPVAVGTAAGLQTIPLEATLTAYLHAFVSNQVQAALRLMPIGQHNGVWILKELEMTILASAGAAANASLADLGSAAFMADIQAMKHEALGTRIFRS